MNEAETRAELIDPALAAAGWGVVANCRVAREHRITKGRLLGAGVRGEPTSADYVLIYRGVKLAVMEAKKRDAELTEGLGQAKAYAAKLQTRFAFSTNGRGFYRVDMETGEEGEIPAFPTPQQLWDAAFAEANAWRDHFADVPLEDQGGSKPPYYYQEIAIARVLERVAAGDKRVLLTLATGTGKTLVAFQIAWKLFQSRWNLTGEPTRRPRILFLADRNILADQAYNAFSSFAEDARVRFLPDDVRKTGHVPKNGNIFFTIFQTFMSGMGADGEPAPNFHDYPADFFDFVIIDECHRGGANNEGQWRGILDYFTPAVQLGLTATPRRDDNADTYAYFGEPVFTYSLKEGINDGFLTPFKVRRIETTLDSYVYTNDDTVLEGEVDAQRRYVEPDFNRVIEIAERESFRVKRFMDEIEQSQKTLVFCASQAHALAVRDLVNQLKRTTDVNYCVRVTADDGPIGEQHLRAFQDNERTIPTILTTSHKLSTGVDARNVRNIVLMRPIKSMIEFKQIIGRGTRLYDDKDYFTIFDFVRAYELFNDPEWDGEPMEPEPAEEKRPGGGGVRQPGGGGFDGDEPAPRPTRIRIKLADGKARTIQSMAQTMFYGPNGQLISAAEFIERLFGELPALFKDEGELRRLWGDPNTRKALLTGLAERGYGPDQLADIQHMIDADGSDLFDVLAYVAYAQAPITRAERVAQHRAPILSDYEAKLQAFLNFVLDQYVDVGVEELDTDKLPSLLMLRYRGVADATVQVGSVSDIRQAFVGFQRRLYE